MNEEQRESMSKVIQQSSDDFESKIIYISAALLGFSAWSWGSLNIWANCALWGLGIAIILNVWGAHYIKYQTIDAKESKDVDASIRCINCKSRWINRLTILFFVVGIILLLIYITTI